MDGLRRYRLFFGKAYEIDPTKEYIAEGVHAQRVIEEIGDPDQGKNGYPLPSSCDRVVRMAWLGLAMDVTDLRARVLCARIKRYPARPVFLVTRLTLKEGAGKKAGEEDVPVATVPPEKQRALLMEGPTVQPAPLWAPAGGTVSCKLLLNTEGRVADFETGTQLCEAVPWDKFFYKPTLKRGRPVRVATQVEVRFEPRK